MFGHSFGVRAPYRVLMLAAAGAASAVLVEPVRAQPAKAAPAAATESPARTKSPLPEGASSLHEVYEDWSVACTQPGGRKQCALSQAQISNDNGQRVLAIELATDSADAAKGLLRLPFGLEFANGVSLQIDQGAPGPTLSYKTCLPVGCIVPLAFDKAMIAELRKGKQLKVVAVAADSGRPVAFLISLKGFGPAITRTAAHSE